MTRQNQTSQPNPFTLIFGKPPIEIIDRGPQIDRIVSDFSSVTPTTQINLISGVRGCGKTVFLTEVANRFRKKEDWIVIDLNPDRDLLESLVSKLYSEKRLTSLFRRARINLSFFGFGVEIAGEPPVTDIEVAVMRMLESLRKDNKRLLITIDEVTNSRQMRIFVSAFQIMLRNDLPVFLLMTGLYKNIDHLRNAETLTFLERAPRTELAPLDHSLMAQRYMEILHTDQERAVRLAAATKGYSFAFQVLGYYAWEEGVQLEPAQRLASRYLNQFAYSKIWSELSPKDREMVLAAAMVPDGSIAAIREKVGCTTNQFNPYRARLIRSGIWIAAGRGAIEFALPWFEDFVRENYGGDFVS